MKALARWCMLSGAWMEGVTTTVGISATGCHSPNRVISMPIILRKPFTGRAVAEQIAFPTETGFCAPKIAKPQRLSGPARW